MQFSVLCPVSLILVVELLQSLSVSVLVFVVVMMTGVPPSQVILVVMVTAEQT